MGKLKKITSKDNHILQITIVLFALICAGIGIACFQYYHRLQQTVKEETGGYMQEIAKQMGTNITKTINDNFAILGTIASDLELFKVDSYAVMDEVVKKYQSHWNYEKIMLVDEAGITYDTKGKALALPTAPYLQDAVVGRVRSMSTSQIIDGVECIVFAIPVDNITIGGTKMMAIMGTYPLSTFDTLLNMTAFDGKGYAHIVLGDGTVVIRSSAPHAMKSGYNILNSLSEANIPDGKTIEGIQQAVAAGENGQTEFILGDTHEYMTYSPLSAYGWNLLTFVPVAAVNQKSAILLNITLLLCGLITTAFSLLFASLLVVTYRNRRRLERIAYVDPVTGGNTIERFYELARDYLDASARPQYVMIFLNIEKFKVLNEQFGKKVCDQILCGIEYGVGGNLGDDECMGRLFADNFCILARYENEEKIAQRFMTWQKACTTYMDTNNSAWISFIMEFGVFIIGNDSIPLPHMIDRAKLSLAEATCELKGKVRYTIYDEQVRRTLLREKQLEDMMEDALKNNEFEVYLQPKYQTQSETIGGAEALVRWNSQNEGMIFPDEFIPLFEKNGFVVQIDLFVFEQVCKTMHRWIKEGKPIVKISINCSRVHLKSPNFLGRYSQIAQKYELPKHMIEIELTENAVFADVDYLSKIIRDIHNLGFGCSMDDFGSGYSSLNLIRDIPVDTIKLDRVFFRTTSDVGRTESVVGSIIAMSKALNMTTVAEGVEDREQVDMLKKLNCDLIQGYYFARPMPICDFEALTFEDAKE